jgi:hypothetical protein
MEFVSLSEYFQLPESHEHFHARYDTYHYYSDAHVNNSATAPQQYCLDGIWGNGSPVHRSMSQFIPSLMFNMQKIRIRFK